MLFFHCIKDFALSLKSLCNCKKLGAAYSEITAVRMEVLKCNEFISAKGKLDLQQCKSVRVVLLLKET